MCLASIGEQLPNVRNRVTLNPIVKDCFGLPVPAPGERAARQRSRHDRGDHREPVEGAAGSSRGDGDLENRADAGGVVPLPRDLPGWETTRRPSVVDAWGRAHDVPNLFIADGSVFVTGGAVNPALTISALATRTAEGIVRAFKEGTL